jgi:hypothetical protein
MPGQIQHPDRANDHTLGSKIKGIPLQAADTWGPGSAFNYPHVLVPLAFKVGTLRGLAAALMQSHRENSYGGAAIFGVIPNVSVFAFGMTL